VLSKSAGSLIYIYGCATLGNEAANHLESLSLKIRKPTVTNDRGSTHAPTLHSPLNYKVKKITDFEGSAHALTLLFPSNKKVNITDAEGSAPAPTLLSPLNIQNY
jgi:hypothetical protein